MSCVYSWPVTEGTEAAHCVCNSGKPLLLIVHAWAISPLEGIINSIK